MQITYITNARLPTSRAHGLQIMKSCEAFAQQGIRVRLVVPALRRKPNADPFNYYNVRQIFDIRRMFVIETVRTGLLRILGGSIAYIQNVSFSVPAVLYAWLRGWLDAETIIYTRDPITAFVLVLIGKRPVVELHDYRASLRKWMLAHVLTHSRLIVMNSKGTHRALQRHYNFSGVKTLVVPNGVDPSFFDIDESVHGARERVGLPEDIVLVGYVGTLETVGKEKGVRELIDMFADVKMENMRLIIVGGPDERAVGYQRHAQEQGLIDRVTIAGSVGYGDVPMWLRAMDILVLPAPEGKHAETTSPIKLFEYLAAGKAILAADIPVYREHLNNENAVLFERGDTKSFVSGLSRLAESYDLRVLLGHRACELAEQHTWRSRAERIVNRIYDTTT